MGTANVIQRFTLPSCNARWARLLTPALLIGCSGLLWLAPSALAGTGPGPAPVPAPPDSLTPIQVKSLAKSGPSVEDIKRIVEQQGIDFDASFRDPKFVGLLPKNRDGSTPSPPQDFALDTPTQSSDNASEYGACEFTLNFQNLNIPQRQGLPGYDYAGSVTSDMGTGQCLVDGHLEPFYISFAGYAAVANCTDSPDISFGGVLYLNGPYGFAYTASAFYVAPPYGETWGGFQSELGHLSLQSINMTDDNYATQGRCAGPPTTKMFTGGYLNHSDGTSDNSEGTTAAAARCSYSATNAAGAAIGDTPETDDPGACGSTGAGFTYYVGAPGIYAPIRVHGSTNGHTPLTVENDIRPAADACFDLWVNASATDSNFQHALPGTYTGLCQWAANHAFNHGGYRVRGASFCQAHKTGPTKLPNQPIRGRCRYKWVR